MKQYKYSHSKQKSSVKNSRPVTNMYDKSFGAIIPGSKNKINRIAGKDGKKGI